MKNFSQKFLTIATLIFMIFQSYLFLIPTNANAENNIADPPPEVELGEDTAITTTPPTIDPLAQMAQGLLGYAFDNSNTLSNFDGGNDYLAKINNLTATAKLQFNPSDLQDIRTLYCLGNVIPDFANHDDALASASGKTIAQIEDLKTSDSTAYQNLISAAQDSARSNLIANLKTDLPDFACIAGVDQAQAADMIAYDPDAVNAIINVAQNKITIDRRVLEMLVNLVTPIDAGGAGHDLIKVYRLRSGYNRDARMNSQESDQIYQQIADAQNSNKSQINTVSDVSAADNNTINSDPLFATAEAQAAIEDAKGASQGDLLFSDNETAGNISAHYKGEAVDISAVDNIKCTLIKKKRIGSDEKTELPAVPINLAWQTSSGYDNSPPPDYSSLASNLQQLAGGNWADLLSQLNISVDSSANLSNANFSDIVSLVGRSLLSEVLNTPAMAITGTTFADTIKKVGGMVLADDLNLPRAAFVNANLADVNDLETKIGEATLEQKLNLPFGALEGNNLTDIFTNIGEKHIEAALNLPANTLTTSISDQNSLKLAIGRREIENALSLSAGTFTSTTTFSALEKSAGKRKIDLIYQSPASVDEILGLDLNSNYSVNYKLGSLSPDAYATLVANKVLADNVYSFASSTAASNALALSVNTSANGIAQATSNQRMEQILAGQNIQLNFLQVGIETLAAALSNEDDVRAALVSRFNTDLASSDCSIPSIAAVNITLSSGQQKLVSIPEDQFMTNFGLQRGDFWRLFGCANVNPNEVFASLGQKALYDAIANSNKTQAAEASFLAQHPEITSALQKINFYLTRIQTIQDKINKINSDWDGVSSSDPAVATLKNNISTAKNSLGKLNATSLKSGVQAINAIRQFAVGFDQSSGALSAMNTSDQNLRNKINGTLLDLSVIAQNTQEILTGQPTSSIKTLSLDQLSNIGAKNTNNSGAKTAAKINVSALALMLGSKLSPENFLISVGSNTIEDSLDLPLNSLYYYAEYVLLKGGNAGNKDAFFQSIGQAQLEETLNLPANFFQGDSAGSAATIDDVRDHVAKTWGLSSAEAGAKIMQALNLPGDFSSLDSTAIFSASSSMTLAANNLDSQLNLPTGTTADFLNGQAISTNTLGESDAELLAGRMNLPQNVIDIFSRVKTGGQSLSDAVKLGFDSLITYNNHNSYVQVATNTSNTDSCPITFTYESQNGLNYNISNQIQDGSYVYIDSTGTHALSSLSQARNYATQNQSKQIDFVKALAEGLASNPSSPDSFDPTKVDQYQNDLNSFLSSPNQAAAFSANQLQDISNNLNVPVSTLEDAFNRKGIVDNATKKPINPYLEFIGERTAEKRIASALVDALGITVAGEKIDAGDIFDLLSGNGWQVAAKIGARYMEQNLGVGNNKILNLVESSSTILRNCSLANLGANFVGGVLGLGPVSLSGNIYDNIGEAKIEKILNLPAGSFHGATLQALIDSVGPIEFAQAFQLPPGQILSPDVTSSLSLSSSISNQSVATQYQLAQSQDSFAADSTISLSQRTSKLESNISSALNSSLSANTTGVFSASSSTASVNAYQVANFLNQAASIDMELGLSAGTTKDLLSGKISPDDFRHKVADTVIGLTPTGIDTWAKLLGVDQNTLSKIDGFTNLFARIENCKNGASGSSAPTACNLGAIFSNFSQIFGYDLDGKLNLAPGSIGRIIDNPEQAAATLLVSALNRLDYSLGLDPTSGASFTAAYIGIGGPLPYNENWRGGNLQFRAGDNVVNNLFGTSDRWQYYGQQIGQQLVGDYLNRIGIIAAPAPNSGMYAGYPSTQDLILQSTNLLLQGDLRILQVSAGVKAAESLHIYNDATNPNLPSYFRISFEDIYYSVMGDPTLESADVQAATNQYIANYAAKNVPTTPTPSDADQLSTSPTTPVYGSQCGPGVTDPNCNSSGDPNNPSSSYSTYASYGTMAAAFPGGYDQPAPSDPTTVIQQIQNDPGALEGLNRAEESARSRAVSDIRNNLLWRMSDAKLYQTDQNIPAGFSRTMYSGTAAQRTTMLLTYAENIAMNKLGFSQTEIDLANTLAGYFQNPGSFNLDTLEQSGKLAEFDTWIDGRLASALGFQLQPGTFSALIYGYKNGSFTKDVKIAGTNTTIPSLETIYKNWAVGKITTWADNEFNLPAGSVYTAYTMYNNFLAAQDQLFLAENFGDDTEIANAQANLTNVETQGIAFAVNLVFSKQISQAESALGLVPGTGSMLVSMLITGFNPISLAIFVVTNLFGVYKTEIVCSADGYYPGIESPPDPTVSDNGNLGTFNGLDPNAKKAAYIAAAQYKARTLIGDSLMLSKRSGDSLAIPSQIMTGRQEDVDYWQGEVNDVICSQIGGCDGTRAGLWANPQTTAYTHIGF